MYSQSDQPDGLIAQLVEHCTGIAEVMRSNPVWPKCFSGFNFTTCLRGYGTLNCGKFMKNSFPWKHTNFPLDEYKNLRKIRSSRSFFM